MHFEGSSQEKWVPADRSAAIVSTVLHDQSAGLLLDRGSTEVCNQMRGGSSASLADLTLFDDAGRNAEKLFAGQRDTGNHDVLQMDRAGAVDMAVRHIMRREAKQGTFAA